MRAFVQGFSSPFLYFVKRLRAEFVETTSSRHCSQVLRKEGRGAPKKGNVASHACCPCSWLAERFVHRRPRHRGSLRVFAASSSSSSLRPASLPRNPLLCRCLPGLGCPFESRSFNSFNPWEAAAGRSREEASVGGRRIESCGDELTSEFGRTGSKNRSSAQEAEQPRARLPLGSNRRAGTFSRVAARGRGERCRCSRLLTTP
jgi:hypothetical protein